MAENTDLIKIIAKAERFCAYQERSKKQVISKLATFGLITSQQDKIIAHLQQNRFLDESRFVESYIHGKSTLKGWGPAKIKQGLRGHAVSEEEISKALALYLPDQNLASLEKLVQKKLQQLVNEEDSYQKKTKVVRYALSKGYALEAILKVYG
jgi:regulatory protein